MKVQKSSAVAHPEGWHLFKIVDEEEASGTFGPQIKFRLQSSVKDDDGNSFPMTYYTGTKLSQHEKCKLTNLFIACGIVASYDEIDDEEGDWDTALLVGKTFEGRVDEPTKEGGFTNIGAVRPRKVNQRARSVTAPRPEKADDDPFADE